MNKVKTIVAFYIIGLPFLAIGIFQKYIFGKVLFIIYNDKLYFFNAYVNRKAQNCKGCGYCDLNDITNVEYVSSAAGYRGKSSEIIIYGNEFTIRIMNGERMHKKFILKHI